MRVILHVDLDAFFPSVEIREHRIRFQEAVWANRSHARRCPRVSVPTGSPKDPWRRTKDIASLEGAKYRERSRLGLC